MERLGVYLLPPGWDSKPSQGYPSAWNSSLPIYTPGWREALWKLSVLPKNTTQCPRPGLEPGQLEPETSALTMRPPRLPEDGGTSYLIDNELLNVNLSLCNVLSNWKTKKKTCRTIIRAVRAKTMVIDILKVSKITLLANKIGHFYVISDTFQTTISDTVMKHSLSKLKPK